MKNSTVKQRKAKSPLWGFGGLSLLTAIILLPTLLSAENGVTISGLSVGAGSVTFNVSWDKPAPASTLTWSDTVWVFVDYNEGGKMKRLSLATGATLTATSAPGIGKVIPVSGNTQGVWVVGNARTTSSFTATVVLPFVGSDVKGACAYASNYPPLGDWNSEGTQLTLTGTAPYTLHLEGPLANDPVILNNVYTLPDGYTLASFTDATGAPGMLHCTPPTAPESLTPSSATVCSGVSVLLTAAGGQEGSNSQFEWGTGNVGANILGTSSAITYSVTPTSSTTYWVRRVSTDGCGVTAASTVSVAVNAAPIITPLANTSTCFGAATTLTVSAQPGSGSISSYLWKKNGGTADGTTNAANYTTAPLTTETTYTVTVTNSYDCSATSGDVVVSINALPTINTQPTATTVCYNTATDLSVTATANTGTSTYQWYKNSASITTSGQAASLATGALTTTTPFYVVVGNTAGCSVTSNTVNVTVRVIFTAGAIATTGQTINSGATVSAISSSTAASGGDGTITYKWKHNGDDISGATAATYSPAEFASTVGTHTFTRFAHDGTCNTAFVQSAGSWVLTVVKIPDGCGSGSPVTIGGVTWACSNVDNSGVFASAPDQYGKLFKWYEAVAYTNSGTDNTYNANYASGAQAATTWTNSAPPCPTGWRVPSSSETQALVQRGYVAKTASSGGFLVSGMCYGSDCVNCNSVAGMKGKECVFFPYAGGRSSTSAIDYKGQYAFVWTSTNVSTSKACDLNTSQPNTGCWGDAKTAAFSIRCVK